MPTEVDKQQLFALSRASSNLAGYFLCEKYHKVYSDKLGALRERKPVENRFGDKSYTFSCKGNTFTFTLVSLIRMAQKVRAFNAKIRPLTDDRTPTEQGTEVKKTTTTVINGQHAASIAEGISSRGHIIGRVQDGRLVFSSEPKIHKTAQSLKVEMAALAAKHPGTKFVSLQITGAIIAAGVVWE